MSTQIKEKLNINLREKLKELSSYHVLVGINKEDAQKKKLYYSRTKEHGTQLKESDVTLGEVAAVHEFGCPLRNIPERSFLRATIEKQSDEIKGDISNEINSFLRSGITSVEVANTISKNVLNRVQERILGGIDPKLSEKTIKRKGHDLQLVDTDQLFDAIKSEVVKSGVKSWSSFQRWCQICKKS